MCKSPLLHFSEICKIFMTKIEKSLNILVWKSLKLSPIVLELIWPQEQLLKFCSLGFQRDLSKILGGYAKKP
jgi:hypothetical protein